MMEIMRLCALFGKEGSSVKYLKPKPRLPAFVLPLALACFLICGILLSALLTMGSAPETAVGGTVAVSEVFQRSLNHHMGNVLDGIVEVSRSYQLSDTDMVAPEPNPACYKQFQEPGEVSSLLARAAGLLGGQQTLFTADTRIKNGTPIDTYLDDTIFAVTWKQVIDDCTYTFSEVKIAHPSQLRRFLSEGKYDSGILHTTTEMSESVNAVVASSGDYYGYRSIGIVVLGGQVYRERGHYLDTCYIDDKGDFLFTYAGEITDKATAQKFVDDHNIRFSLCFGPVMVLDGEYKVPNDYNSGEINQDFPRSAICQLGQLHYLLVTANTEEPNYSMPTVAQFGLRLQEMGIPTAYALDGGQTAAIVMGDRLINTVSYGSQREISDIVYFATAMPEDSWNEVSE